MNIYFDTEFTGLRKDTTLISIGLIDDNSHIFYAEFTDYDKSQVDDWIQENVIKKLILNNLSEKINTFTSHEKRCVLGDKETISEALNEWLDEYDSLNFITDVGHYDFVLLVDLLTNGGSALDLSDKYPATYEDINQLISLDAGVSVREVFDWNREELLDIMYKSEAFELIDSENKHNSLEDAYVIKWLYKKVNKSLIQKNIDLGDYYEMMSEPSNE